MKTLIYSTRLLILPLVNVTACITTFRLDLFLCLSLSLPLSLLQLFLFSLLVLLLPCLGSYSVVFFHCNTLKPTLASGCNCITLINLQSNSIVEARLVLPAFYGNNGAQFRSRRLSATMMVILFGLSSSL